MKENSPSTSFLSFRVSVYFSRLSLSLSEKNKKKKRKSQPNFGSWLMLDSPSPSPPDLHPAPPPPRPNIQSCPPKTKPKASDSISSGERILSFVIRAIVMAAAIPLFFLFASVAAILLLHLWIAGTALRRRNPNPNLVHNPNLLPNPLDLTPTLSPAELRRMPCCMWRWPWPKDQCCAVCLEKVQRGELYRSLPACAHVFHKKCVDKWLLRCPKCPLCREVVRPLR